jgi:hypothetical protein
MATLFLHNFGLFLYRVDVLKLSKLDRIFKFTSLPSTLVNEFKIIDTAFVR